MDKLSLILAALVLWGCDQASGGRDAVLDPGDAIDPVDAVDTGVEDMATDTGTDTGADVPADTVEDVPDAVTARVQFATSMGTFVVGLYGNAGPITTTNFLRYVDDGFYEGLVFHRVIADFMIQAGGYDESLTHHPPPYPPITLEIIPWLSHQPGVISMARTTDPDSATSQFFVCVADDSFLDGDYAAFGMVESGMDVVDAISVVPTHSTSGMDDVPVTPVVITSATRL